MVAARTDMHRGAIHGTATCRIRRQDGFTYLMLLLWVALAGVVLAALGTSWSLMQRREREAEWWFAGQQYRHALQAYRDATPAQELPRSLEQLIDDRRGPVPRHYLRQMYPDPITGGPWALKMQGDRIAGVYSTSSREPLQARLGLQHYSDQIFEPDEVSAGSSGAASGAEASTNSP